jgi:hypothetical protein
MKINGKTFSEAPVGFSEASSASSHQESAVTPKLVTRTADAAKLMPAERCVKNGMPGPAGDAPQITCVPFEDFPASQASDCVKLVRRADSLPLGAASGVAGHDAGPTPLHDALPGIWQARRKTTSPSGQTLSFNEAPGDMRIAAEHKKNVRVYFTAPWISRLSLHQKQLEQGRYLLRRPDGGVSRCTSYSEFMQFTGKGAHPLLPELILHVAGPQLHNFLCQTYLYNQSLSLFQHVGERRVEPMPELRTMFELECHQDGRVSATYVASDENLGKAMLVGRKPYDEYEASPIHQSSLHFSGTLLFSPALTFSIAPVRISATGMQFATAPESATQAVTDSFA